MSHSDSLVKLENYTIVLPILRLQNYSVMFNSTTTKSDEIINKLWKVHKTLDGKFLFKTLYKQILDPILKEIYIYIFYNNPPF